MTTKRRSTPFRFDPDSLNATLATIIANQSAHAEEMRSCFDETKAELSVIKAQAFKTNGRVSMLELWRATDKAKLAGMGAAFGLIGGGIAWVAGILLGH